MTGPIFSIITAARACPQRVRTLVQSLARQSWPSWEIIVSVDDPEPAMWDQYVAALSGEPRARLAKRTRYATGPGGARNDAVACASGEYIVMLDADDTLRDDYLQAFAVHFHHHPDCPAAITPTRIIREDEMGDAPVLFAPALDAAGAVGVEEYSRLLVSTHAVCRREAHIAWPEDCFAEDVVRDALIVAAAGSVPIVDSEYRARIHPAQYTQTSGFSEEEIRQTYLRIAVLHPQIAPLFVRRAAANAVFAEHHVPREDWYTFWSRHADQTPSTEEIEATGVPQRWERGQETPRRTRAGLESTRRQS